MKDGDFSRELFDDLRRQRAPRGEGFEQRAIVEAAHFDNGVDEFARAIERESAIRLAGDAPRAKIERRRGAPVERDLALAHGEPLSRRREIEIGKGDRALQFEGARSAEHDARNMRRNNLAAAVERGEKAQRLFLRVGVHAAFLIAIQAAPEKIRLPGINPLSPESPDVTGAPPAMGDDNET